MKKLLRIASLLLILLFAGPEIVFADAWIKVRSKCRWYRKKYKGHAHLKYCGAIFWLKGDTDKGCETFDARAFADPFNDGGMTASAWRTRRVINQPPFEAVVYEMGTFVPQFAGICGGENNLLQPSYLSYSPIVETQKRSKGSVGLESEEPIFDYTNRVIILKNIKGHFNMASGDIINDFLAFTISLTNQPEEFNEGSIADSEYREKLLWSAKALLNNGKLIMNSNFASDQFTFNSESKTDHTIVNLNMDQLVIPVPEGMDMDNLVVNIGSDAGNLGYGISDKFKINKIDQSITIRKPMVFNEIFDFTNYPNPVSKELNIQIKLKESSQATIILYDTDGNPVQEVFDGKIISNKPLNIVHELKGLKPNKVYFLKLITNKRTLIRKVLVE